MKKKTFVGAITGLLLILQMQTAFANGDVKVACLSNPNRKNDIMGRVSIDGNSFSTLVASDYSSGSHLFENIKNGAYSVTVKSFKWSRNEWREAYSQMLRIEVNNNSTNITCSFDNNGKILNLKVDKQQDLVDEVVSEYIEKRDPGGLQAYLQKNNIKFDEYINKRLSAGNTRLINEIKKSFVNFGNVQFLIDIGAKVNLRNELGETAASIAYDKGEIEVYNYLKEHGAIDFEPKQIAQQPAAPASQTNVYVQPPVSTQSAAPVQNAQSSSAAQSVQQSLQRLNQQIRGSLENGTYKISGRLEEISFAGIANSGSLFYKDASGNQSRGTYSINGDRITMNILGRTFFYTITSRTSFTGNGETWMHRGY